MPYKQVRHLVTATVVLIAMVGCAEDRETVEDRVFKDFTRLVCTNTEADMADDVVGYAHFILKYNEKSGHITAAQLVNSSSSIEKPPQVAWSYNIDEAYKGTDYLLFDLKLGRQDDRENTMFELDRGDLSMRASPPGLISSLNFQCEKMNDTQFESFLDNRRQRLKQIESQNQI